jgi:hypothetical protein
MLKLKYENNDEKNNEKNGAGTRRTPDEGWKAYPENQA